LGILFSIVSVWRSSIPTNHQRIVYPDIERNTQENAHYASGPIVVGFLVPDGMPIVRNGIQPRKRMKILQWTSQRFTQGYIRNTASIQHCSTFGLENLDITGNRMSYLGVFVLYQ
jgi:hypothetical protein